MWRILLFAFLVAISSAAEKPNLVLVLADDLGYGDLHCYGAGDIHSPNLDAFAAQGVKFTSCYAAHANCSPSRTALMTGRTPTRVGVRDWIPEESPVHLRRNDIAETTEQDFKTAEPVAFELYNLRADLAETTDLAAREPAKLGELKTALLAKYHEVRAESPTWPAWKFTGAEGRKIVWPDDARKPKGAKTPAQ